MSTIIRTEFGNYDVWNGRIYQISPQLRQALQGRQVNSPAEMQAAIQFLREKRNREIQEARSRAEQERRRAELLQSELQLIAALQNRQAVATAAEQSNRRVEQQRNERQRRAEQVDSNVSPAIRDMRLQQNRTINEMERNVQESMRQMHSQLETRLNTLETAVQGVDRLTEAVGEIERRIERQFEQQQQQVNSIQSQLDAIASRGDERAKIAVEWMETVEKSNQLDRFVPEEAESVRRRLQNLQQSQASGAE
jgi:DNA repair exonuclease SbcCD ATPase subunit